MRESKPRTCLIQNWSKQTKICNQAVHLRITRSRAKLQHMTFTQAERFLKYICARNAGDSPPLCLLVLSLSQLISKGYGMLMISNRETWLQDTKNIFICQAVKQICHNIAYALSSLSLPKTPISMNSAQRCLLICSKCDKGIILTET